MHKITLICSSHRESGHCNVRELLRILQELEPDTIFEEVRPTDCTSHNKFILEGRAVTAYRMFKSFQRVPIDQFDMPPHLRAVMDSVLKYVSATSPEYLALGQEHDSAVLLQGFTYLNSLACERVMTRMSEIEERTSNYSGDQSLIRALGMWREFTQRRDAAMVSNIYKYCRENTFDTGLFLVGAAHRGGVAEAIKQYASAEAELVEWTFGLGRDRQR